MVSPQEKAAFEERGFHVLRGALSPDEVAGYRKDNLDLNEVPRYAGTGTPVVRGGRLHLPYRETL